MNGSWRRRVWGALALLVLVVPAARAQDPIHKAGRGIVNVLTAWIEVPNQISVGLHREHPVKGLGWGITKGLALMGTRLVLGLYEAVTFPIPCPKGYASPYEGLELADYAWE